MKINKLASLSIGVFLVICYLISNNNPRPFTNMDGAGLLGLIFLWLPMIFSNEKD
jgi:hypothetical protein